MSTPPADFADGTGAPPPADRSPLGRAAALWHTPPMARKQVKKATRAAPARRGGPAPKLLAGGNPQIPKGDGDAPVRAYLAAMPGWKRKVGKRLDALVAEVVPDVRRAVRWNTPFYGLEGNGWFLAFHCFDRYVKVTFFRGDELDPLPPVASKQAGVRYAHVHEDEALDEERWRGWIEHAAQLPGERCF